MKIFFSIVIAAISGVVLLFVILAASLLTLPDVRELETCFTTSMYQVHLCPESENYAKLQQISPYVLHAVIASEDGTFYSHDGFDWHEMEESFNANLHSGHIRRGGSTITQQLAKNVFLGKEKSFWRKIKEAYLAHGIEKHYPKDFILEKYLNVVEFGENLYGVKAAAEHYFHKPAAELNPLEAAYLAFLLPNPKSYSKSFKTGKLTLFAHRMLAVILKRMSSYGKLSPEAFSVAMAQLDNFPWSGLSRDEFRGTPTYSLDATVPPPPMTRDEQVLEQQFKDDDQPEAEPASNAEEAAPPASDKAKEPGDGEATDPD